MRQDKQFDDIIIAEEQPDPLKGMVHQHNYYQFIYIKAGSGRHFLNGENTSFCAGDLFFISPRDQHSFEIDTPAKTISIRFSEHSKGKIKSLQEAWKGEFPGLKKGRSPLNIKVNFSEKDLELVEGIFNLLSLVKNELLINESLIYLQIIALVSLIERNLSYGTSKIEQLKPTPDPKKSIELLLTYINRHISRPEMLTATQMAEQHGVSVHYIGAYFKRHAGMTVKGYINQCRQTIIVRKLLSSTYSVSRLAADFNYTDESHFNKSFKKYWGMSPSIYRQIHQKK